MGAPALVPLYNTDAIALVGIAIVLLALVVVIDMIILEHKD